MLRADYIRILKMIQDEFHWNFFSLLRLSNSIWLLYTQNAFTHVLLVGLVEKFDSNKVLSYTAQNMWQYYKNHEMCIR